MKTDEQVHPFGSVKQCPKCEHSTVDAQSECFLASQMIRGSAKQFLDATTAAAVRDWVLVKSCYRCGYAWLEKPKDSIEET